MSMGAGILPERHSAKSLAMAVNAGNPAEPWTEGRAQYVLDGLVERGLATRDADDLYTITGLGLGMGERMGIVKPLDMGKGGYVG